MAQFLPSLTPARDENGNVLTGAVWKFYQERTLTPQELVGGATSVTSGGDGDFAPVELVSASTYRARLLNSAGRPLLEIAKYSTGFFSPAAKAALDILERAASGATWSFYTTATTTPQPVYADPDLTIKLGAVVQADGNGVFPQIYLDPNITYKAVYAVAGVVQNTIDPVDENSMGQFLSPTFQLSLEPSADWDGTAGSGFDGSFGATPVDPTRTTAKPALRLLVPDQQFFTDELLVGVDADALNGGTLTDGIDTVTFHYEGNTATAARSVQTFTDYLGATYSVVGYWVRLSKPSGTWSTANAANLYVEATPTDPLMQRRVIGPYKFTPTDTLYDVDVTVKPSEAVSAGVNYQTLEDAIAYAKAQTSENGRIRIGEAGNYDPGQPSGIYAPNNGRLRIEATVPGVTIRRTSYTTDASANVRPLYDHMAYSGLSIDMRYISQFNNENTDRGHWFDRCHFYQSGGGRAALIRSGPRFATRLAEDGGFFTDCLIEHVNDPLHSTELARGNIVRECYRDVATNSKCAVANKMFDHTAKVDYALDIEALTITGPSGSTLSLSGNNDASVRILTAKESAVSVGTFEVGNSDGHFAGTSGDGYTVQDVADWVNGLSGWTATVASNARRAAALGLLDDKGRSFTDEDTSAGLTLYTYFDQHGDIYQHLSGGPGENVIFKGNSGFGNWAQNIFLTAGNPKDFIFTNNAFDNVRPGESAENKSQFETTHSHVIIAHNTMPVQEMAIRAGYTGDARCLFANNAVKDITDISSGSSHVIANNILDSAATGTGDTGEIKTGDESTKFTDAINGDFTPAGAMLTNLVAPIVERGLTGTARGSTDALGAFADGEAQVTYTASLPYGLLGAGLRQTTGTYTKSGNNFVAGDFAVGMPDYEVESIWFFFPAFGTDSNSEIACPNGYTIEGMATRVDGGARTTGLIDGGTASIVIDPSDSTMENGRWIEFTPAEPIPANAHQIFSVAQMIPDGLYPRRRTATNSRTNIFGGTSKDERSQHDTSSLLSTLDGGSSDYAGNSNISQPTAAMARKPDGKTSSLILGTSIAFGAHQATNVELWTNRHEFGFMGMGLDDNVSSQRLPFLNWALSGWGHESSGQNNSQGDVTACGRQIWAMQQARAINRDRALVDMLWSEHGTNTSGVSSDIIQAYRDMKALWQPVVGDSNMLMYQAEMLPKPTSSDGWVTNSASGANEYPTGSRWEVNEAIGGPDGDNDPTATLQADGTIDASFAPWKSTAVDTADERDRLANLTYVSTLDSDRSSSDSTVVLTDEPRLGGYYHLDDGTNDAAFVVRSYTGSGPYTCTTLFFSGNANAFLASNTTVREIYHDITGLHPGPYAHSLYRDDLTAFKSSLGYTA